MRGGGLGRIARIGFGAALVVALAALAWGLTERRARGWAELQLFNARQQAAESLVVQTEQVVLGLSKALAAGTPAGQLGFLVEVWGAARAAQENAAALTWRDAEFGALQKFYTQTGDFALALSRALARGAPLEDGDWERLAALHRDAGTVAAALHRLREDGPDGGWRRGWIPGWPGRPARPITPLTGTEPRTVTEAVQARPEPAELRVGSLADLDAFLDARPPMVYDGPFSDHLLEQTPRGVSGPAVDAEEAVARARAFLGLDARTHDAAARRGALRGIPTWTVTFTPRLPGAGSVQVDVTRRGGHVVWALEAAEPGPPRLSLEEAEARARAFLLDRGFERLEVTSAAVAPGDAGRATISFAPTVPLPGAGGRPGGGPGGGSPGGPGDGAPAGGAAAPVVVYPDRLIVTVRRDTGAVAGYDALGWLMHHQDRELSPPAVSEADVRTRLNPRLEVDRVRPAVIPLPSGRELLAWEVRAAMGPDRFRLYYAAEDGAEVAVLQELPMAEGWVVE